MDPMTLHIRSATDTPILARLVMPGDGYGDWNADKASWSLTLEEGKSPLVEFFDQKHMRKHVFTPFGQFTGGRYPVDTFPDHHPSKAGGAGAGLVFDPILPEWQIDAFWRECIEMWVSSHPRLVGDAPVRRSQREHLRAVAQATVKDFQYECIARSDAEMPDAIWRCRDPKDGNYAHDLVISKYGISAFGDMDALSFNVGSSYGLKFLAGSDVEYYIHSKLDQAFREQVELDPERVDDLLGQSLVMILDTLWLDDPKGRADPSQRMLDAVQALRTNSSRCNLSRLLVVLATESGSCGYDKLPELQRPRRIAIDFMALAHDIRDQGSEREVIQCLECAESDFDVALADLLSDGFRLTRPSSNLITRLYVLNIGARRILEQQGQQEAQAEPPAARDRSLSLRG